MTKSRIAVTGMGVWCPIGTNIDQMAESLVSGKTAIKSYDQLIPGTTVWAAIVEDFEPEKHFDERERVAFDRTAQMGYLAAAQAMQDAGVEVPADPTRCGLILGTSHGGRSQLDRFVEEGNDLSKPSMPERLVKTSAHYHQTAAVASKLGIHGPTVTLSNACSSSGAAIAYAIELVRSGKCDWVLAGGADGFSKLTYAGFAALGAVSDGPCAPFSEPIGLSLGDGAGFVIIESLESAHRRNARVHAELYGYGLSWDAYHITAPEPAGEGMNRAIAMALAESGVDRSHVEYVNVHGTGTRSNDAAETVGLKRFFALEDGTEGVVPPISATKSFTGHMLGASSVLGVITSIVGMQRNWLPPTANFSNVRPGCELDCIPNTPREKEFSCFMAQSAAFAGANAVIVGGRETLARKPDAQKSHPKEDIVISGMGIISPIGLNAKEFALNILSGTSGLSSAEELIKDSAAGRMVGLVKNFNARKLMPTLNLRRVDQVAAYATVASSLALQDARLWPTPGDGGRIGLVVGVARGAASSYERYLEGVKGGKWSAASAVHFPNLVMSSVGGQVSSALGIRGITSSLVGAGAGGIQVIAHALELFRSNPHQDAVVVVTSDELTPLYFDIFTRLGLLKSDGANCPAMNMGAGAVAWVLERASAAIARHGRIWGRISGYGLTNDASLPNGVEVTGKWLERAIELALSSSHISAKDIDTCYRLASGRCELDRREIDVLSRMLCKRVRPNSVTPLTGYAEAASGMMNATAAILELQGIIGDETPKTHALVTASGEEGSHAAIVLEYLSAACWRRECRQCSE